MIQAFSPTIRGPDLLRGEERVEVTLRRVSRSDLLRIRELLKRDEISFDSLSL
jgi:hypothetical protein